MKTRILFTGLFLIGILLGNGMLLLSTTQASDVPDDPPPDCTCISVSYCVNPAPGWTECPQGWSAWLSDRAKDWKQLPCYTNCGTFLDGCVSSCEF